ncbi:MAG: 2-oxoacid:acceptor oxidoreductase family protein, partial [Deltaproteobacteria bacterium]|nr:2-oxoacid:acceptor oxidoreductase family protein [Deltaproteobacteria bacterium]
MIEIMFQGMGGHGSVVAAKLLAQAAAKGGFQAQSFASYGALRRGGKVEGYVRISREGLMLRCKMYSADYLVVMDETLIDNSRKPDALKRGGKILINSHRPRESYSRLGDCEVYLVDAYGIAREKGLVIPGGMPVINTALLGALAGILDLITIDDLVDVIKSNTPKPEKNVECAMEGYRRVILAWDMDGDQRGK